MPAAIAPAIGSLLGAAGITVSATTATSIATAALYAGTVAAQMLLFQPPDMPEAKIGTKLTFEFGSDVEQSILVGPSITAGSLLYAGSWKIPGKTPNGMLTQVFIGSDIPIQGPVGYPNSNGRIWFNGERDTINWGVTVIKDGVNIGSPVTSRRKGVVDYMWVKYLDGSQTVADPYLRAKFGSANKPWKSTMIGRGRAIFIVTTKYDKKEPAGLPQGRFECRGAKFYSCKKDSMNGGSGPHRWGVRDTYEYTEDPPTIAYNFCRGIYYDGQWLAGGRNWPAYLLNNDSFVASTNVSQTDVPLKNGGTQKRFTIGGEFSLSAPALTTLAEIRAACTGRMSEAAGVIYFDCGELPAAMFSISDADCFVNEARSGKIQSALGDKVNTINGTFTSLGNGGQSKALPPRTSLAYVGEDDGQELKSSADLRLVVDNAQGQRVTKHMLDEGRRQLSRQVILGPNKRSLRANRCINWDSDKWQYDDKKFAAGDIMLFPNGLLLVETREADPNDGNDWEPESDEVEIDAPFYQREVVDTQIKPVTVAPFAIKNNAGANKKPGLKITWIADDDDVDGMTMAWRVRLLDSEEIIAAGTADFLDGQAIVSEGILRNEAYQVQAKLVPTADWRPTDWTEWDDTDVYPAAADHVVAGNYYDADDSVPAALPTPTMTLVTRRHRDGKIRQRIVVSLDLTGRPATERYRVRLLDTTEDPDEVQNFPTDEFPFAMEVQTGHSYTVRVLPVSRAGVVGPLSATATGVTMPIPKKSTSDGAVPAATGLSVAPGHRRNDVEWVEVDTTAFNDWGYSILERDNSSAFSGPNYKKWKVKTNKVADVGIGNADQRHYRVTHYDTSDNPGASSSIVNSTTPRLDEDDYTNQSVTTPKIGKFAIFDGTTRNADFTDTVKSTSKKTTTRDDLFDKVDSILPVSNSLPSSITLAINISASVKAVGAIRDSYASGALLVRLVQGAKSWTIVTLKTSKKKMSAGKVINDTITLADPPAGQYNFKLVASYAAAVPSGALASGKVTFAVKGAVTGIVQKR